MDQALDKTVTMQRSSADNILNIPSFCEHYEPLLVEEIALVRHPTLVHHGKCALIGYLPERSNGLESLMVPSLPENMQLPDATACVQLSFDNYRGSIPRNCTVRVYGTMTLQGLSDSALNNSRELICHLEDLKQDLERRKLSSAEREIILEKEKESMRETYHPVLDVHGCERVSRARELIGCNLRLKRINRRLASRIRDIENGI
ncbi:hypothetical protein RP20_CCG022534 [Aedes albopictus]|nr:hypothetical protein RP20_CCG022534 [Aedes albopictus]